MSSWKAEVDKIDIDKLNTIPADLSKIHNVVDNNIVKKMCLVNWLLNSMQIILEGSF